VISGGSLFCAGRKVLAVITAMNRDIAFLARKKSCRASENRCTKLARRSLIADMPKLRPPREGRSRRIHTFLFARTLRKSRTRPMRGATAPVIDRPVRRSRSRKTREITAPGVDLRPGMRFADAAATELESAVRSTWIEFKQLPHPDQFEFEVSDPETLQQFARRAALRDWLIIHYMSGHVQRIAQRLHKHLPPLVELDDLINETYDALVGLIEGFDLAKNNRFETYSSTRLQGAMLDYLRSIDPAPRLVRYRAKKVQAAIEQFRKLSGRAPSFEELRRHMAMSERVFAKFWRDARPALMINFNSASGGSAADASVIEDLEGMDGFQDRHTPAPLSQPEREDLRQWITKGFARRDRLILVLYYYEQMTMRDIGDTLGCSESRVSQRLDVILKVLRARLDQARTRRELVER